MTRDKQLFWVIRLADIDHILLLWKKVINQRSYLNCSLFALSRALSWRIMPFINSDKVNSESLTLNGERSRLPAKMNCQYQNTTEASQVVRISNIEEDEVFERTVSPGQKLFFETLPEAVLEVCDGETPTALVIERIPCLRLRASAPRTSNRAIRRAIQRAS